MNEMFKNEGFKAYALTKFDADTINPTEPRIMFAEVTKTLNKNCSSYASHKAAAEAVEAYDAIRNSMISNFSELSGIGNICAVLVVPEKDVDSGIFGGTLLDVFSGKYHPTHLLVYNDLTQGFEEICLLQTDEIMELVEPKADVNRDATFIESVYREEIWGGKTYGFLELPTKHKTTRERTGHIIVA